MSCAACGNHVYISERITCCSCKINFHNKCLNINDDTFNKHKQDYDFSWLCPTCKLKNRRNRNEATPIENIYSPTVNRNQNETQNTASFSEDYTIDTVTYRKNLTQMDTSILDKTDLLGDTISSETTAKSPYTIPYDTSTRTPNELTLQNLREMFDSQLKDNNRTIIQEIQNTVKLEIGKAISTLRAEVKLETNALSRENLSRKAEIENLTTKIEELSEENRKIKQKINEILNKNKNTKTTPQITREINNKKIVLHGLSEYYGEHENDLYYRIIDIFKDILHVDLFEYIEDTKRIGKYRNTARPLVIELISKRMTRYIVENGHYFQGTNLSVTEYLDKESRENLKKMREEMFIARKKGLHAVIKNNLLYIEGRQTKMDTETNKQPKPNDQQETETENNNMNDNTRIGSFRRPSPIF